MQISASGTSLKTDLVFLYPVFWKAFLPPFLKKYLLFKNIIGFLCTKNLLPERTTRKEGKTETRLSESKEFISVSLGEFHRPKDLG